MRVFGTTLAFFHADLVITGNLQTLLPAQLRHTASGYETTDTQSQSENSINVVL